jgi:hypothetical protein
VVDKEHPLHDACTLGNLEKVCSDTSIATNLASHDLVMPCIVAPAVGLAGRVLTENVRLTGLRQKLHLVCVPARRRLLATFVHV